MYLRTRSRYIAALFKVLLCSVFVAQLHAQSLFNRTYVGDRPVMLFGSVLVADTIYYVTGVTTDRSGTYSNYDRMLVGQLDNAGVLFNYRSYYDSIPQGTSTFTNSLIGIQNGFASTGYTTDSTGYKLFIAFGQQRVDSIVSFVYSEVNSYKYGGMDMLEYNENSYYVVGIKIDSFPVNTNVMLCRIDSDGNRNLIRNYGASNLYEYGAKIIQLQNSNLLIGAFRSDLNQTNERSNTWLLEVDTGGNIMRQWFDPNDSTYAAEGLRQTQDGGFIYGAQKKFSESGGLVSYINTIVKMDSSFNKQWTYTGGYKSIYTGISDIEELPDGNFIACGQYPVYGVDTALWGCIVKLDVSGNVIWERLYRGINQTQTINQLADIDVLPDGSLIAVGQCQRLINPNNLPPQVGWFLKLDSNGCEVENCILSSPSPLTPEGGTAMRIQPNPATNFVQVETENEMLGAELKVFDVTGKLMLNKTVVEGKEAMDVSGLSSGMYVIIAEKQGKFARAKLVVE